MWAKSKIQILKWWNTQKIQQNKLLKYNGTLKNKHYFLQKYRIKERTKIETTIITTKTTIAKRKHKMGFRF